MPNSTSPVNLVTFQFRKRAQWGVEKVPFDFCSCNKHADGVVISCLELLTHSDTGFTQVTYPSVSNQCNLVPARQRLFSAAGKLTVGLVSQSHWPCVTDYRLMTKSYVSYCTLILLLHYIAKTNSSLHNYRTPWMSAGFALAVLLWSRPDGLQVKNSEFNQSMKLKIKSSCGAVIRN